MLKSKSLAALAFATILAASSQSYAQTQPDAHHTNQGQITAPELAPVPQGQQDMMMNMMSGMMKIMMGGGQMGMGGMDMQGMGMTQHVEGRIAFLRAELKITDKQDKLWDAFAEALRKNAKGMMDANMPMMESGATPGLVGQLDAQERMMSARLDGVKAMKATLAPLYEALSDEQRKTADEELGPHMGLMGGGMMQGGMGGMMPGGMMPKQSNSQ